MTLKIEKIHCSEKYLLAICRRKKFKEIYYKKLCKLHKLLKLAINHDNELERQIKMSLSITLSQNRFNSFLVARICAANTSNCNNLSIENIKLNQTWRNCGQVWNSENIKFCPAQGKNCLNCGLLNNIGKMCRHSKVQNCNLTKGPN